MPILFSTRQVACFELVLSGTYSLAFDKLYEYPIIHVNSVGVFIHDCVESEMPTRFSEHSIADPITSVLLQPIPA